MTFQAYLQNGTQPQTESNTIEIVIRLVISMDQPQQETIEVIPNLVLNRTTTTKDSKLKFNLDNIANCIESYVKGKESELMGTVQEIRDILYSYSELDDLKLISNITLGRNLGTSLVNKLGNKGLLIRKYRHKAQTYWYITKTPKTKQ